MAGRAGKSFSLSLLQSKLRKIFVFISNQSKTTELTEIFQKFHIGTTEAESLCISELLSLSRPLG